MSAHARRGDQKDAPSYLPPFLARIFLAGGVDPQLFELAVQVRAFQTGLFGNPRHAVIFSPQMIFEVNTLELVACVAQRLIKGNSPKQGMVRSEERRVEKECVRT